MSRSIVAAALALVLAACQQQPAPQDADPAATATAQPVEVPTPISSLEPQPVAESTAEVPGNGIPSALQGNWGMVPKDCTSTRGDNKGLLRITDTTLQFYESLARLGTIASRDDHSLRATFAFSGEGMTWSRVESLSVEGDTLTRSETGGDEPGSAGPFRYTRCPG